MNDDSTDSEVSTAEMAVANARTAIANAEDVPAEEKTANTRTVEAINGRLTAAKTSRTAAMEEDNKVDRAAKKAMAAKLYAGLATEEAAAATATNALRVATISITPMGVSGDVDGTGAGDPVTIKPSGTAVSALGDWMGTDYVRKTANPALTDHVVLYSNRGAPTTALFATKYATELADGTVGRLDDGVLTTAANRSNIASDSFASGSGFEDHTTAANDVARISGTYDGATGYYHCQQTGAIACRSQVDGEGGITLVGGWSFEPNKGVMASTPDAEYVIFGWWSREVSAGVDVATFAQRVGGTTDLSGQANAALTGTAEYLGGAAGKYSINEPVEGNPEAGAFTANAKLTAKFGNATDGGTISGMLYGFMAGGMTKDWTVDLKGPGTAAEASISTGGFGTPATPAADGTDTARTVWTIGGSAAAATGSWSGDFYYDTATKQTAANTPMTAAGTFSSEYGNVGRMVGAFGAHLNEE